jgi:hypothetical protein
MGQSQPSYLLYDYMPKPKETETTVTEDIEDKIEVKVFFSPNKYNFHFAHFDFIFFVYTKPDSGILNIIVFKLELNDLK